MVALTPSIKIKIKINKDSIKWKLYSLEDHFSDQSCNTAIFKYTHTNSNLLQEDDLKLTDRTSGYEKSILGLPWWLSGKESALQCRRHGSNPWSGKIPNAAKHLSECASTIKSPRSRAQGPQLLKRVCPGPLLCDKRSRCGEKLGQSNSRGALSVNREKPAQQPRSSTAKNKIKVKRM